VELASQPKSIGVFHKTIAIFVLISFTLLNTSINLYAQSLPGSPSSIHGMNSSQPLDLHDLIGSLELPKELGHIDEVFVPENRGQTRVRQRTNLSSGGEGLTPRSEETAPENLYRLPLDQLVIYVQNAHANFDSENATKDMIRYFKQNYGLRLILLEGGEGKLDNLLFQSYPNSLTKKKILNHYLEAGDLQGGEVAAILEDQPHVKYYGIETQALYEANRKAFLEAVNQTGQVNAYLKTSEEALDQKAKTLLSAKARQFLDAWQQFAKDDLSLLEYIRVLKPLYPKQDFASQYQEIAKSFHAEAMEAHLNDPGFENAMRQLMEVFQRQVLPALSPTEQKEIGELIQAYQVGGTAAGFLIKHMQHFDRDHVLEIPEPLDTALLYAQTLSSIKGTHLFEEVKALEGVLRSSVGESEAETTLLNDYRELYLLKQLAQLELTPQEWEEIQRIADSGQRIETNEIPEKKVLMSFDAIRSTLNTLFKPHLTFYQLALERNDSIFQNTQKMMAHEKVNLALLSTGGFHSAGITEQMRQKNIPYILISPQVDVGQSKENYWRVMQGKRSFMDHYTGSIWEAFARDYTEEISKSLSSYELTPQMKRWRGRIIQNAIAEGRVTEATQYTQYVDQLMLSLRHEMGASSESTSDIFQSILEVYFGELSKQIDAKLEGIKKHLINLWQESDFSASSVQKITAGLSLRQTTIAAPLVLTNDLKTPNIRSISSIAARESLVRAERSDGDVYEFNLDSIRETRAVSDGIATRTASSTKPNLILMSSRDNSTRPILSDNPWTSSATAEMSPRNDSMRAPTSRALYESVMPFASFPWGGFFGAGKTLSQTFWKINGVSQQPNDNPAAAREFANRGQESSHRAELREASVPSQVVTAELIEQLLNKPMLPPTQRWQYPELPAGLRGEYGRDALNIHLSEPTNPKTITIEISVPQATVEQAGIQTVRPMATQEKAAQDHLRVFAALFQSRVMDYEVDGPRLLRTEHPKINDKRTYNVYGLTLARHSELRSPHVLTVTPETKNTFSDIDRRLGYFIRPGDPVFLIGEGAREAAQNEPYRWGAAADGFNRFQFEEYGVHRIYMRLTNEEWELTGNLLLEKIVKSQFSGYIFIEVEGKDFKAMTVRHNVEWDRTAGAIHGYFPDLKVRTRNTRPFDARIPDTFTGMVIEVPGVLARTPLAQLARRAELRSREDEPIEQLKSNKKIDNLTQIKLVNILSNWQTFQNDEPIVTMTIRMPIVQSADGMRWLFHYLTNRWRPFVMAETEFQTMQRRLVSAQVPLRLTFRHDETAQTYTIIFYEMPASEAVRFLIETENASQGSPEAWRYSLKWHQKEGLFELERYVAEAPPLPSRAELRSDGLTLTTGLMQSGDPIFRQPVTKPSDDGMTPDYYILNRPVRDVTERPVFNLPGLKDKNYVTQDEIATFVEQDRQELEAIARRVSEASGKPITVGDVLDQITARMETLLEAALKFDQERKFAGRYVPVDLSTPWKRFWFPIVKRLSSIDEPHRYQEKDGVWYVEAFWEKQQIAAETAAKALRDERGYYSIENGRYIVSMTRLIFGRPDVLLGYQDPFDPGKQRTLRLNAISIALAKKGIFYKGAPEDNLYQGMRQLHWDQTYPTSPKDFYENHIERRQVNKALVQTDVSEQPLHQGIIDLVNFMLQHRITAPKSVSSRREVGGQPYQAVIDEMEAWWRDQKQLKTDLLVTILRLFRSQIESNEYRLAGVKDSEAEKAGAVMGRLWSGEVSGLDLKDGAMLDTLIAYFETFESKTSSESRAELRAWMDWGYFNDLLTQVTRAEGEMTPVAVKPGMIIKVNEDFLEGHIYQIVSAMWRLRQTLHARGIEIKDGLPYEKLGEAAELPLDQDQTDILAAIGQVAGWWDLTKEKGVISHVDLGALGVETLFGDTNLANESYPTVTEDNFDYFNRPVMEEEGVELEELMAAVGFKIMQIEAQGDFHVDEGIAVNQMSVNFDTKIKSKLSSSDYYLTIQPNADQSNVLRFEVSKGGSLSLLIPPDQNKGKVIIARGTFVRSELRSSATVDLNNLDSNGLREVFRKAYAEGRLQWHSQHEAWQDLETNETKLRVAGVLVLRNIGGEWHFLLGQRGTRSDRTGTFTSPAGKVGFRSDADFEPEGSLARLRTMGILSDADLDPQHQMESTAGAAVRELSEETQGSFAITTYQLDARLDDFRGNHPGILVSIFLHVDDHTTGDIGELRRDSDQPLLNFQWVPLRVLLDSAPGQAGESIEAFLRERFPESPLMTGLSKNGGLENLKHLMMLVRSELRVSAVNRQDLIDQLPFGRLETREIVANRIMARLSQDLEAVADVLSGIRLYWAGLEEVPFTRMRRLAYEWVNFKHQYLSAYAYRVLSDMLSRSYERERRLDLAGERYMGAAAWSAKQMNLVRELLTEAFAEQSIETRINQMRYSEPRTAQRSQSITVKSELRNVWKTEVKEDNVYRIGDDIYVKVIRITPNELVRFIVKAPHDIPVLFNGRPSTDDRLALGEVMQIGEDIRITVNRLSANRRAEIGFDVPRNYKIHRMEINSLELSGEVYMGQENGFLRIGDQVQVSIPKAKGRSQARIKVDVPWEMPINRKEIMTDGFVAPTRTPKPGQARSAPVLTRKEGESIVIGDTERIEITVKAILWGGVVLNISVPHDLVIQAGTENKAELRSATTHWTLNVLRPDDQSTFDEVNEFLGFPQTPISEMELDTMRVDYIRDPQGKLVGAHWYEWSQDPDNAETAVARGQIKAEDIGIIRYETQPTTVGNELAKIFLRGLIEKGFKQVRLEGIVDAGVKLWKFNGAKVIKEIQTSPGRFTYTLQLDLEAWAAQENRRAELRITPTNVGIDVGAHVDQTTAFVIQVLTDGLFEDKGINLEKLGDALKALHDSGLTVEALTKAISESVANQINQMKGRLNQSVAQAAVMDRLREDRAEDLSAPDLWRSFIRAAQLIEIAAPSDLETWARDLQNLLQMSVTPSFSVESLEFVSVTEGELNQARQAVAAIQNMRQATTVEFQLPAGLDPELENQMADELMRSVRDLAIVNPNIRLRFVAVSESQVRFYKRLFDRLRQKDDSQILSSSQVNIVTKESVLRDVGQTTLVITADLVAVDANSQAFGIDRYGDHSDVIYEIGKVTLAKQLIAAVQSLVLDSNEWIVADQARSNVVRPLNESSLLALALQLVIKQLAIEAEGELMRARAA